MESLEHAKRIKRSNKPDRLDVLLCLKSSIEKEKIQSLLTAFDQVELNIVRVARYAPLNREQYNAWTISWPLSYREDTRLDPKFTQKEIDSIHSHMQSLLSNHSTVVCRIVDPNTNEVKAEACDTRKEHPLHHAIMNSINTVAQKESQLAGGVGRMKRPAHQMTEDESESPKNGYLCTGYDIYITHEPCAM